MECPKYRTCNAPLCPLDKESLKKGVWYPDEAICSNQRFKGLRWIKIQRRIKKRAIHRDRYFTYEMLTKIRTVRKSIRGLNPAKPRGAKNTPYFELNQIEEKLPLLTD